MNRRLSLPRLAVLAALGALAWSQAQAAALELRFKEPEKFADIGWPTVERERNLEVLREVFTQLAARLPDDQLLQIEVTQVDLAGWIPPAAARPLRVLSGSADWPRIDLRFTVRKGSTAAAPVLREGSAEIADMNYLQRSLRAPEGNQSLGYERQMLNRWFTETFPEARPRRTAAAPARAASTP